MSAVDPGTDRPGIEFLEFLELRRACNRRGVEQGCVRMATLWSRIVDGKGDSVSLLELERRAHSLAGSGATIAFSDLAVNAKALELAARRLLD